VKTSSFARFEI